MLNILEVPDNNLSLNIIGTQTKTSNNFYPEAESYEQYDQRTHVYMKPDMYIGADSKFTRNEWLLDITKNSVFEATIDLVPGIERCFLEIISNASDNVGRSRRAKVDPGNIEITMDRSLISVINYGLSIPIEVHPKYNRYVPEMIFGSMLTGSNYGEYRHDAGTNGIGAKAVNIFSTEFTTVIFNHVMGLKYTQKWEKNMIICHPPLIETYVGKISSVQIIYTIDFARFGYKPVSLSNGSIEGGYPDEAFYLFARHAADISFTCKVPVIFNGKTLNYGDIREYARLYFGDAVDTAILHYQWPANTEIINKKGISGKNYQIAKDSSILPEIELIAVDTPDQAYHASFVNCVMTKDGGVHVNAAFKAIGDNSVKMINENTLKKLTRQNRGKELDAKDKRTHTITINDVKPHISILLNTKLKNPKFTSQTKTSLHSPVPKIEISEQELHMINRWKLIPRLQAAIEHKQFESLAKTSGKLSRNVFSEKAVNANDAGGPNRRNCVAIVAEGKSALGYVNKYISLAPGGRDIHGSFPMKGKPYNVMGKTLFQIEKNAEIKELVKMLGLVWGTDYSIPANFDKLRYGSVMIMADSDVDGKHIIGLIVNFFHCMFPSLLAIGYIWYYKTPSIRVSKGKISHKFYTQKEYDDWAKVNDYKSWTHEYYKGLGSSSDAQIEEDFIVRRIIGCYYDPLAPDAIRLAFAKDQSDNRKEWIRNWNPDTPIEDNSVQPISNFINHEMILFSIANIERSIPKLMDGLKEVQRKTIFAAHHKWNIRKDAKDYKKNPVGRFGFFTADKTMYHHGELILGDVIVKMSQDFVGSNNMTWFTKEGQFGCLDPNTSILLWNGQTKLAKDITLGDKLVGDDNTIRNILQLVDGFDHMYKVRQTHGDDYTINSLHILTLSFSHHGLTNWDEHSKTWSIYYYDHKDKIIKCECSYDKSVIDKILLSIGDAIFDIELKKFLSWPKHHQKLVTSVTIIGGKVPLISQGGEISIEYIGIGPYVGWYLDGNKRFLLGDNTVTHNSRYELGEDAAQTRYSGIKPEALVPYIFRKEDEPILDMLEDQGENIEPSVYYPVIPIALVNGVNGIGTGHSSTIPNHNPLVIIEWYKSKLQGTKRKDLPQLIPWYRGFTGTIKIIDRRPKKELQGKVVVTIVNNTFPNEPQLNVIYEDDIDEDSSDTEEDDPEYDSEASEDVLFEPPKPKCRPLLSVITTGSYHITHNGTVVITEFPIGKSPAKYCKKLEKLVEAKKITGFRNLCSGDTVYFEIYGMTGIINHQTLKLRGRIGMSNMVLLDENNKPIRYDTAYDILKTFYKKRLAIYQKRKDYIIPQLAKEIEHMNHKIKYIRAVKDKVLRIINERKQNIYAKLDELGIPHEIYKKSKAQHFSEEDILALTNKILDKEEKKRIFENTSPKQMWLQELQELEFAYCKRFNVDYNKDTPNIPSGNKITHQPITILNITPDDSPINNTPNSSPILNIIQQ